MIQNRVLNRSNRKAVPAVVVVRGIDCLTIEVQVPGIRLGVVCRWPISTVRPPIVERRTIVDARGREEDTHSAVAALYDVKVEWLSAKPLRLFDFSHRDTTGRATYELIVLNHLFI